MRLDCHVHTRPTSERYGDIEHFNHKLFMDDLKSAGLDGAAVYSLSPKMFPEYSLEYRMNAALEVCKVSENLFPFFWIDPLSDGAVEQVELAVKKGFDAFKMIPTFYRIDDDKPMAVIEKIASVGKPVMFHSGICFDGEKSSHNLRPCDFEALIKVQNLKFCLAHISWPWTEECIALFGKFRSAKRRYSLSSEMFIDVTPGTPELCRDEVFRHLLLIYNMRDNLMFGSDCNTGKYEIGHSLKWQNIDDALYEKYITEEAVDFKEHVYYKNLLRFLGKDV